VYVLAADVNTLDNVGQANVTSVGLTYPYTIDNVTAAQVVVVAGTDTDNDGIICNGSEPCGLYPVFGGRPVILEMAAGNRTGIDFQLVSGGASAASLSAGTLPRPAKGYRRVMP
jgi:serine protease